MLVTTRRDQQSQQHQGKWKLHMLDHSGEGGGMGLASLDMMLAIYVSPPLTMM